MGKLRHLSFQYSRGKGLAMGSVQSRGKAFHLNYPIAVRPFVSWAVSTPWSSSDRITMGGGLDYAAVTETLSAVLCGWLALPAGLFFESQGCGVWWVSDDSPAFRRLVVFI